MNYRRYLVNYWLTATMVAGLFFATNGYGQSGEEYSIFNYSVEKGLSQSTVYSICQDSQGFIWIGTRGGGLNRFDGYDFRIYRSNYHDPYSISGNEVISIYEDKQGELWVGNRNSGLDRFDKDRQQFIHYRFLNDQDESCSVNCFLEDRDNRLWMGTDRGLFEYIRKSDTYVKADSAQEYQVSSLCEDKAGRLVLGSRNGILLYDKINDRVEKKVDLSFQGYEKGRQWNPPILLDSRNNLWFGTLTGLYLVKEGEKWELTGNPLNYPLGEVNIRTLHEDRNGYLWIGFESGLLRLNPATGESLLFRHNENNPESIGHNSVYSLIEDDKGNIWIGTWGGGISMLSHMPRKFMHFMHIPFTNSLSHNLVSSFAESGEGIWIGTEGGGLNLFNPVTREFSVFRNDNQPGKAGNQIKCVVNDSEGRLWAGTWGSGLYRFDKKRLVFENTLERQNVFCLA